MDVRFADDNLDKLEREEDFNGGYAPAIVAAFRKRMQIIRTAPDERVIYQSRALRFEKLKGKRDHQHSMRLNDQWRLIIELQGTGQDKTVVVVSIEDYH